MNASTIDALKNESNSTIDLLENPMWNWLAWNLFVWLFPPVCLVGALANAASFCVIVSNLKSFPYVTRQYLSIITASDFLILTCKASTHYLIYVNGFSDSNKAFLTPRKWGLTWCIVYDFCTYYSMVGAHFFQLGLTVDRLIAVAAPMRAKLIMTHWRSWLLLGLITAMSLLLPVMFVSNSVWLNNDCSFRSWHYFEFVYQPIEFYFGRVFLISALTAGTAAVCLLLAWNNRAARVLHAEANSSETQQQRQKYLVRISLMLVSINLIFLATALPWTAAIVMEQRLSSAMGTDAYMLMLRHFNSLLFVNNAVSWVAYFMGSKFREAFCRSLRLQPLRRLIFRRSRRVDQRVDRRQSRASGVAVTSNIDEAGFEIMELETTRFLGNA